MATIVRYNYVMNRSGQAMMFILFAALVVIVSLLMIIQTLSLSSKGGAKFELQDDLVTIGRILREGIDCTRTLSPLGDPPVCNDPDGNPIYFPIRNVGDQIYGTPNSGSWKYGRWNIRASCEVLPGVRPVMIERVLPNATDPLFKGAGGTWRPLYLARDRLPCPGAGVYGVPPSCGSYPPCVYANSCVTDNDCNTIAGCGYCAGPPVSRCANRPWFFCGLGPSLESPGDTCVCDCAGGATARGPAAFAPGGDCANVNGSPCGPPYCAGEGCFGSASNCHLE